MPRSMGNERIVAAKRDEKRSNCANYFARFAQGLLNRSDRYAKLRNLFRINFKIYEFNRVLRLILSG